MVALLAALSWLRYLVNDAHRKADVNAQALKLLSTDVQDLGARHRATNERADANSSTLRIVAADVRDLETRQQVLEEREDRNTRHVTEVLTRVGSELAGTTAAVNTLTGEWRALRGVIADDHRDGRGRE